MMRRLRHFFLHLSIAVGTVGLAAACVPLPGNRQLSRQMVVRKEAENTLVSDEGATCRVKADAFETVNVGDQHACVWKYADSNTAPTGGSATGPVQDQAPRRAPIRPGSP